MKSGIELISEERERQIIEERWTSVHDDSHNKGELVLAAHCYITDSVFAWPWDIEWYKPKDRIKNLVRAGALLAAELDRIQRLIKNEEPIVSNEETDCSSNV